MSSFLPTSGRKPEWVGGKKWRQITFEHAFEFVTLREETGEPVKGRSYVGASRGGTGVTGLRMNRRNRGN
ncbi:uncharacterized protein EI90DRAFT_3091200 [Cantharellus anzutake]|uniref:uncharacterized protein n=1 Tax=Cantharellus anzutake TaxID=1750568 RepID=UPI0019071318|nr:uncharacterized protein EI90DRAFT_3091200 [Cantharellus anzutake]KAF8313911.1 hypothetical protein EI90DRAFT_3091200 [Cantharellus anzutake]